MMKHFFGRILELPELKLFLNYWFVWIPVAILLIAANSVLIKRK